MGATLEKADRLRVAEPAEALALYAAACDEIDAHDEERLLWICDQVAPTPPVALGPLLHRVADTGTGVLKRAAIHTLATQAWYTGDSEEAEFGWRRGIRENDGARDLYWIRSVLNLANAQSTRDCVFEPMVLTRMGQRVASELERPYLRLYATTQLANILLRVNDPDGAQRELASAEAGIGSLQRTSKRRVIRHNVFDGQADLYVARGQHGQALRSRTAQIEWIESYGYVEDAVLAVVMIQRLRLLFDLRPKDRADWVQQCEAIPDRFDLQASWRLVWERTLAEFNMRFALEQQADRAAALHWGRRALALLHDVPDSQAVLDACVLGRTFADELRSPDDAREAFELASVASLRRILEAHRDVKRLPELAEATPEDYAVLQGYQKHLSHEQQELLSNVARHLRPGEPAFELLSSDSWICLCAWCGRVRAQDHTWLPVSHLVPQDQLNEVTHGICESCRRRHFDST